MKRKRKTHLLKQTKITGLLLVFAAVFVFMQCNAFLYQDTVVKIISVDNVFSYDREGPDGDTEQYYDQSMRARILNGEKKGAEISLSNTYSDSGVNDERYRKGDRLFVAVSKDMKTGMIIGKKRDVYLVMLISIFLFLLLLLNEKRGGIIFVSLLINISVFLFALSMYGRGGKLISIAFALMLVFSILTLLFAGGIHKKTFVAIPADLSDLFLTGVLMGSLGAVMDVSISIAAGVAEIIKQAPDISIKALIQSVREMGYDIMGTMINVLFFTYISSAIPILVVKIKNGYTLYHLVNFQLIFEIIRFLMGAIGIVLAIPISGLCAVLLLHMGDRNKEGQVK